MSATFGQRGFATLTPARLLEVRAELRRAAFDDGYRIALEARHVREGYGRREVPRSYRDEWIRGFDAGARERARRVARGLTVLRPGVTLERTEDGLVLVVTS